MTWSPVSSADETIAPVIFARGALLRFGCLFWGQMLCLAALSPENSKRMDRKYVSFRETRLFWFFSSPFLPRRSRSAEGQDPGTETALFSSTESQPAPAPDPHPNLSSIPRLSLGQVASNTYTHAEEGKKENNNNESQWTNQSFPTAWKSPGRDCCYFCFQTGVQTWWGGPGESEGSEDGKEILKEERICSLWTIKIMW